MAKFKRVLLPHATHAPALAELTGSKFTCTPPRCAPKIHQLSRSHRLRQETNVQSFREHKIKYKPRYGVQQLYTGSCGSKVPTCWQYLERYLLHPHEHVEYAVRVDVMYARHQHLKGLNGLLAALIELCPVLVGPLQNGSVIVRC